MYKDSSNNKMLEFLKKIFQNEEQQTKKVIEVRLYNLEEWLNEKSKPLMEEVQQQIEKILMKVNEEAQRAKINLEVLENAKLQNSNIPFKAKQYMEGNRKSYIRTINSFLGKLEINNKDYFYLANFCDSFDEQINDLNKGTLRSYTILQEFLSNETSEIAQNLKNFDNYFGELKLILNDKKIVDVNNAKEKAKSLKIKSKQKINLDIDFKGAEADLRLLNNEKDTIMLEIMNFNKSEENNKFLQLNEEKKNKLTALYSDENQILQSFSVLQRPLRKYSHVAFEHEEIVLNYLKQPIETLANDKNLVILQVLKNMEKLMEKNKLQIDDKKKEKSLEEIKKLSGEFVEQFLKKYFSYKSEMAEIEDKINASGVPEKLKNFNKRLKDINFRIEKNNEEFNGLKNEVAKSTKSMATLINDIESYVKDVLGEEVKIIQ